MSAPPDSPGVNSAPQQGRERSPSPKDERRQHFVNHSVDDSMEVVDHLAVGLVAPFKNTIYQSGPDELILAVGMELPRVGSSR
jgi:hypothetical protein